MMRMATVVALVFGLSGCTAMQKYIDNQSRQQASYAPASEEAAPEEAAPDETAEAPVSEAAAPEASAPSGPTCSPNGTAGVQGSGACCSGMTRWGKNAEGWICCGSRSDTCT